MKKKMNAALSLAIVALLSLSFSNTVFADQRAGGVLRKHQAGEHPRALGQERWQAHREVRIHQAVQSSLR